MLLGGLFCQDIGNSLFGQNSSLQIAVEDITICSDENLAMDVMITNNGDQSVKVDFIEVTFFDDESQQININRNIGAGASHRCRFRSETNIGVYLKNREFGIGSSNRIKAKLKLYQDGKVITWDSINIR